MAQTLAIEQLPGVDNCTAILTSKKTRRQIGRFFAQVLIKKSPNLADNHRL